MPRWQGLLPAYGLQNIAEKANREKSTKEFAKFNEKNMHLYQNEMTKSFESFGIIRTQVLKIVKNAQKRITEMYKMHIDTETVCC